MYIKMIDLKFDKSNFSIQYHIICFLYINLLNIKCTYLYNYVITINSTSLVKFKIQRNSRKILITNFNYDFFNKIVKNFHDKRAINYSGNKK